MVDEHPTHPIRAGEQVMTSLVDFRADFFRSLTGRADAASELCDAALCAPARVPHPAPPRPRPRRRPAPARGTTTQNRPTHPRPRPKRISPTTTDTGHSSQPTKISVTRPRKPQRHPPRAKNPLPSHQENHPDPDLTV